MNKKGFVASAVLYSLLLLFLALILGLLALLSNRKMILDRLKNDIKGNITKVKLYEKYDNGKPVYYNPVKGEVCSDYSENNSKTGVKEGCLKWYIFNDTSNNDTVNMILDHNITPLVPYNSTDNSEMKEVKTALESDTKDWKNEARLITAEEIAHITQADKILNWQLNKEYLSNATYEDNKISYFYFNGKEGTDKTWRTKLSTEKGKNSYAWLFDYTYNCTKSGCNIEDNEKYTIYNGTATNYVLGYWTSDGAYKRSDVSWSVHQNGILHIQDSTTNNYYGVRPVIKIEKTEVEKSGLTTYSDGSIVYYNPVKGKRCIDYDENNSKTGVKEDCLKWYIFNDNKDNSSVNMLLDHNTTGSVVWSSIDNTEMKEVKTALENDTKNWVNKARLITVDEVAKITKADKILKFDSKKIFKRPVTDYEKEMSWFYFDGQGSIYEEWQTQVANKTAKSKYTWLFDNLKECTDYGCNKEGDNLGYWTSNAITGYTSTSVWYIYSHGMLGGGNSTVGTWNGVRPVIQIEKTKLTEKIEYSYDYTGGEQTFVAPVSGKYKIELWGAQGGNTFDETTSGGLGGYVSGIINFKKNDIIYIYVGQQGTNLSNNKNFNGGTSDTGGWNGGGATDIRLTNGLWDNFSSLKSRIMVAAGGGTEYKDGVAGAAGGLNGYGGSGTLGGTQTSSASSQLSPYSASKFGIANGGCTGGNGYYAGGGAACASGSGGGSSFISGHEGCNAISSSSIESNIIHTGQSKHYSGLYFTNTVMIDGNGYSWTNVVGKTIVKMPSHDGKTTMIGNNGNGYAKITYLEE